MSNDKKMYKGWEIEGVGGFCTMRHYWASKGDMEFWQEKLKWVKTTIDLLENDPAAYAGIPLFHKQALYQ